MMGSLNADIRQWFEEGKALGATHLIVACNRFDENNYHIHVLPNQNVFLVADEHRTDPPRMRELVGVYSHALPLDQQLDKRGVYHFEVVAEELVNQGPVLINIALQASHAASGLLSRLLEEPYPELSQWRAAVEVTVQQLLTGLGIAKQTV